MEAGGVGRLGEWLVGVVVVGEEAERVDEVCCALRRVEGEWCGVLSAEYVAGERERC